MVGCSLHVPCGVAPTSSASSVAHYGFSLVMGDHPGTDQLVGRVCSYNLLPRDPP